LLTLPFALLPFAPPARDALAALEPLARDELFAPPPLGRVVDGLAAGLLPPDLARAAALLAEAPDLAGDLPLFAPPDLDDAPPRFP
jgi:hypothetical protein